MGKYLSYWAGIASIVIAAMVTSGCATTLGSTQSKVIRAKNRVAPALVHIRPVKEIYTKGRRTEVVTIGSGFIISPDGYVVTNEHVAGESNSVHCVLGDKNEVEAKVVGVDPYTDIAVLKLDTQKQLPYVRFGNSDQLEAGQMVMALGSPHGLARSVSLGIVSVTDRHLASSGKMISPFNNWIQTDAAINPGNSGGPLVNLRGEVVGVNARVLQGAENVGFAIPVDIAREVVDQLIANGEMRRSRLGIDFQEMLAKTNDPNQRGVVVGDVDPLSPASEAGIQPGDVLLALNGAETNARFEEDLPALRKRIADLPIGQEAVLTIKRGDKILDINVVTEEQSQIKGAEQEFADWGFTASELTAALVRRAQLASPDGVLVSGVQVGGHASNAGLSTGDIILKVDEEPIPNMAAFRRIYNKVVRDNQPLVLLAVKRGALTRFVLVKQVNGEENETVAGTQEGER